MYYYIEKQNEKMFKYLYRAGCKLTENASTAAAKTGNMDIMVISSIINAHLTLIFALEAAKHGNLDVLNWMAAKIKIYKKTFHYGAGIF